MPVLLVVEVYVLERRLGPVLLGDVELHRRSASFATRPVTACAISPLTAVGGAPGSMSAFLPQTLVKNSARPEPSIVLLRSVRVLHGEILVIVLGGIEGRGLG